MSRNLMFIDPETGEEYHAGKITPDMVRNLPVGQYKVVCEISQFGIWGSKSFIIIRDDATGEAFWYVIETFDDPKQSKRERQAKAKERRRLKTSGETGD